MTTAEIFASEYAVSPIGKKAANLALANPAAYVPGAICKWVPRPGDFVYDSDGHFGTFVWEDGKPVIRDQFEKSTYICGPCSIIFKTKPPYTTFRKFFAHDGRGLSHCGEMVIFEGTIIISMWGGEEHHTISRSLVSSDKLDLVIVSVSAGDSIKTIVTTIEKFSVDGEMKLLAVLDPWAHDVCHVREDGEFVRVIDSFFQKHLVEMVLQQLVVK